MTKLLTSEKAPPPAGRGAGLRNATRLDVYAHQYGGRNARKTLVLRLGSRFRVKGRRPIYTFWGYWEQKTSAGRKVCLIEAWSADEGTRYLYIGKKRVLACGHTQVPYKIRPVRSSVVDKKKAAKKTRSKQKGK